MYSMVAYQTVPVSLCQQQVSRKNKSENKVGQLYVHKAQLSTRLRGLGVSTHPERFHIDGVGSLLLNRCLSLCATKLIREEVCLHISGKGQKEERMFLFKYLKTFGELT